MDVMRYIILGQRKEKGFVGPSQKPVMEKTWRTGRGENNLKRDLKSLERQRYQTSVFKTMPKQLK